MDEEWDLIREKGEEKKLAEGGGRVIKPREKYLLPACDIGDELLENGLQNRNLHLP